MVAFIAGVLGLQNVFAVGAGAVVSLALAAAGLAFAAALTLCRDRSDRHLGR